VAAVLAGTASAQWVDVTTLDGTNGFAIYGAEGNDVTGHSISGAGDVNGDGFADFVAGAVQGDGPSNSRTQSGETYIVFGKTGVFAASFDFATVAGGDGSAASVLFGAQAGDESGWRAAAAGDFNGDGFADIVLSAPGGSGPSNTRAQAGEIYIVFGKAAGFGATTDLAAIQSGDGSAGFVMYGPEVSDYVGHRVSSAGDVNGDGFSDILVSVIGTDGPANSRNYSGEVYLVFGSASPGVWFDLATLDGTNGVVIYGAESEDKAGLSVKGAGDVNGDGFADVAIGADGDGPANGRLYGGESYIVFGKAGGFSASIDLLAIQGGTGTDGFAIYGAEGLDYAVAVSGAGDVNGDGFSDIVVGARSSYGPANSRISSGECCVIFGKSSGFGTSVDLADIVAGSGMDGFTIYGAESGDQVGESVASAGDVNGDGLADVIVSAQQAAGPANARMFAGECYVIFGKTSGFGAALDLASFSATDGIGYFGSPDGDLLGATLSSAGDINGDGATEVLMGAGFGNGPGNTRVGAGESYLAFGSVSAASATSKAFARSGNSPQAAIGVAGDGTQEFTPASRCWIDFDSGTGPGLSGSSLQTVTLTRSNASLSGGLSSANTANAVWELTTNRTAWTSAAVTFKYTDAEIVGLTEGNLRLYKAPSVSGPWTELATTVDAARNMATATVSSFSFFALSDQAGLPVEVDSFGVE